MLRGVPETLRALGKNKQKVGHYPTDEVIGPYKEKSTLRIITPAAPENVLDKSFADVSFLAGLLICMLV